MLIWICIPAPEALHNQSDYQSVTEANKHKRLNALQSPAYFTMLVMH